ncbi:sugar ABC transporter ATP-binding protein [Streptosporangium sp. NPDC051022]|uniref:sugar ABC transporter ATP-binding protein n=1 Tax=Streptosporangium sp. NPDC051022 TaxID=3155752 RepID=UPI00342E41CB
MNGQHSPAVLSFRGLSKTFGGTRALVGVDLDVDRAEVHGLVGHNGSGKSTLIKILSGFHHPDPGAVLRINGRAVALPTTQAGMARHGVRFVHQHLGLIPAVSVAENLMLGELSTGQVRRFSLRRAAERAAETFARYGLSLDPYATVESLPSMERANLAIVRAVEQRRDGGGAPGLLVLDEPTAFLPPDDKRQLYRLVRQVVAGGDSVLFVSHFLEEVLELCDRVTVLRDARVAAAGLPAAGLAPDDLVAHIVGGRVRESRPPVPAPDSAPVLGVRGLSAGRVDRFDLVVRHGEIVGVTGLVGSGFEDVVRGLFGAIPARGSLTIGGETLDLAKLTPRSAIRRGIGFVPGDRDREGVIPSVGIAENMAYLMLGRYTNRLRIDGARLRGEGADLMRRLGVRAAGPAATVDTLSGGNAQKTLLGKWLSIDPKVLLLLEPSQGVDVGARAQLTGILADTARGGTGIVCASADPEQLADICNRVLVLRDGRVARELAGAEVTKETITEACLNAYGGRASARSVPTDTEERSDVTDDVPTRTDA